MCKAVREMNEKAAENKAVEMAKKLIKRGKDTVEEISDLTGLPLDKVRKIAQEVIV